MPADIDDELQQLIMDDNVMNAYQQKFQNLNLEDLESDAERINLLDKFSSKYLLLPDAWKMRIQCEKNLSYPEKKSLVKRALNDFYSEELFDSLDSETKQLFESEEKPFDRCLNWRYFEEMKTKCAPLLGQSKLEHILKEALSFPHSKLSRVYFYYKRYSGKFVTKKMLYNYYHRNLAIYKKIEDSVNDLSKWCYWIQYTKDNRFIIQNIECRLAKYPFEMQLWRNYMLYLLAVDKRAAFDVYHRYRKFFIDDNSMDSNFCNLKVRTTFYNINYLEKSKFGRPYFKRTIIDSKKLNVHKILPKIQKFSFRASFLNYFLKNASLEVAINLFQSCKQLFLMKNIPFCHSLFVAKNRESKYFIDSLLINESWIDRLPCACLEMNLVIEKCSNSNILSNIIPKLKTCNIEYLNISHQNFSTIEYEILTQSKKIQAVIFSTSVTINDKNGNPIALHYLLKNLTNAHHIDTPVKISTPAETALHITQMKMKKPIIGYVHLLISSTSQDLPSAEFVEFCTKHKRDILVIQITSDKDMTPERLTNINVSLNNALFDWKIHHPNEKAHLCFKNL